MTAHPDPDHASLDECDETCAACELCGRATGKSICREVCCHAAAMRRHEDQRARELAAQWAAIKERRYA